MTSRRGCRQPEPRRSSRGTVAERFERIVVGGGAMGLATAWQLATRGVRVLVLEQFTRGHRRGASHGATRNLNNAYAEEHYLDLFDEAFDLWRALERDSAERLLTLCGLVTHGDPARVRAAYDALTARGAAATLISPGDASRRWPGMRFSGEVLVNRDAGRVHAATALSVLDRLARERGATIRERHRVESVVEHADGVTVLAVTPDGVRQEFEAEGVVVTAGAWSEPLLDELLPLPALTVTEEHPAHFAIRAKHASDDWPSFNHFMPADAASGYRGNVYGMFTPGEGVKVGFHATGEVVDPDARRFRASAEARLRLEEYVRDWFPGLDPSTAAEISCTYTLTESERFVLDTRGRVTVGAGFSGQGFKFVPAVGRVLADATLGTSAPPAAFQLSAHGV